ncbi:MAG: diaminopimelate epimerase [Clostridia bacterium]|nr:diaminopimelate epimerase [Clostridia bacterium]
MKFTKMQGAGNDYVYVDCTKEPLANAGEVARFVSDRHFGIGSDGLILIKPSDKADFFMEMYNSDGSRAQMCGNGIRCVAKYVYDYGLTTKKNIAIDTLAGVKYIELNVDENSGKAVSARVNMGSPVLEAAQIPVRIGGEDIKGILDTTIKNAVVNRPLNVSGNEYNVTCVSMGNPHCVVFTEDDFDMKAFKIEQIAPAFENHEQFPERINTEFIKVIDRKNLEMRVWERGAGETFACGTGACASLVAAVLNGLADDKATLHLLGGDLEIEWNRKENLVFMEGPAVTVFEGEIDISGVKP